MLYTDLNSIFNFQLIALFCNVRKFSSTTHALLIMLSSTLSKTNYYNSTTTFYTESTMHVFTTDAIKPTSFYLHAPVHTAKYV